MADPACSWCGHDNPADLWAYRLGATRVHICADQWACVHRAAARRTR